MSNLDVEPESAPGTDPGRSSSRRFKPSGWSERLVPLVLILLLLFLVGTILLAVLSLLGALPNFA